MTPEDWRRAQEVFLAATEREPESREAFLNEECRGDPELKKEVESLLSSFRAAPSTFLESPAVEVVPKVSPGSGPVGKGTRLGPYEILGWLGAGGMGEVYRARDPRLNRDVAIKVLPAEWSSDSSRVKRFEQEAQAAGALNHPNITGVYDVGRQGALSYVVQELLEGETLRAKLAGEPLSFRTVADYGIQIARGLAAAHEKGIVHRDLKPENLFVTKDGPVKILDFGLAKLTHQDPERSEMKEAHGETTATEPGAVMGTVGYMSPEQVQGEPVDQRSDIFALGTILYEMLSGHMAFRRNSPAETMAAIMRDDPPEITDAEPNVPVALDRIVRQCLEKDSGRRYQSARDVAAALLQASAAMDDKETRKDRKTLLVLLAVLAITGTLLVMNLRNRAGKVAPVKRVVVLPFENLGSPEDDYLADGLADAVRGKLTALPGIEVIARGSSIPYKKTTETPQQIAVELDAKYLLTATVRRQGDFSSRIQVNPELMEVKESGAPASRWAQPFNATLTEVFQVQSEIATRVALSLGLVLGRREEKRLVEKPTVSLAAYDSFLKGEEASKSLTLTEPESLRRALDFYERAVALDPEFSPAWAQISRANSALYGNSTPTPALAERARQTAVRSVAIAPELPDGYLALGTYQRLVMSDFNRALEQLARGLRLAPGNTDLLRGVAVAESALGRWEAGVGDFQRAERLDPRSIHSHRALGEALLRLRRYPEARKAYDGGLALAPANLTLIEHKAMTFLGEGNLAAARNVLAAAPKEVESAALVAEVANYWDLTWVLVESQRALLVRLTPSAFDDDRGAWGLALAQAYSLNGDNEHRRSSADEARRAYEEQLRTTPNDAGRHAGLGLALAYLGRREEAIREGERAVTLYPVARGAYFGPYVQHQLVRIYMLVGEPGKAVDTLEPLLRIPYYLSPAWLRIDPNFDSLRKNSRFQKLCGVSE